MLKRYNFVVERRENNENKKKYYFLTIVEIVGLNFLWPISAKRALSFKIVRGISICVCL